MDDATQRAMFERHGLAALDTASVMSAFYQALQSRASHVVALSGDPADPEALGNALAAALRSRGADEILAALPS